MLPAGAHPNTRPQHGHGPDGQGKASLEAFRVITRREAECVMFGVGGQQDRWSHTNQGRDTAAWRRRASVHKTQVVSREHKGTNVTGFSL